MLENRAQGEGDEDFLSIQGRGEGKIGVIKGKKPFLPCIREGEKETVMFDPRKMAGLD